MHRPPSRHAFTLIEMITVIAVIAILAGLVLSVSGLVQNKGYRAKAEAEIRAMGGGLESYKTDNGGVPQEAATDNLNARSATSPGSYKPASLVLYKALSGDANANGEYGADETAKNYLPDFFKPARLGGVKDANGKVTTVTHIMDPFGQSYGYSTAGLKVEQDFRAALATDASASRPAAQGYNSTYDLWSTGGATGATDKDKAKWLKNWGN